MNAREQLDHLLEVRRGLVRELDRLDQVILNMRGQEQMAALAETRGTEPHEALTWEEALHEAKIPVQREVTLAG